MKIIVMILLASTVSATELVPLDVMPGKWESKVKNVGQDMISSLLNSMPDGEQKEKIKQMVNKKMKEAQQKDHHYCLTKEEIANPKDAMKKFTENKNTQNCKMKLLKSTSKNMDYEVTCTHQGMTIVSTFKFEAKNPKLMVGNGVIPAQAPGIPDQQFKITSKWIKETCH